VAAEGAVVVAAEAVVAVVTRFDRFSLAIALDEFAPRKAPDGEE
jgi:hypothetical protein